jgi:hypothetical protein
VHGLDKPGSSATVSTFWFFSWFKSLDGAQFYILLNDPGTMHVQHLTAIEFKSDGAVIDLIDAVVIQLPDRPCDLDTDHLKGETGFVPPFSHIHSYGVSPPFCIY